MLSKVADHLVLSQILSHKDIEIKFSELIVSRYPQKSWWWRRLENVAGSKVESTMKTTTYRKIIDQALSWWWWNYDLNHLSIKWFYDPWKMRHLLWFCQCCKLIYPNKNCPQLHNSQFCLRNYYEKRIFNDRIFPQNCQRWQHCYFKSTSSLIIVDKDIIAKLLYDLHLKFQRALLKSRTCLEFTRTLLELSFID